MLLSIIFRKFHHLDWTLWPWGWKVQLLLLSSVLLLLCWSFKWCWYLVWWFKSVLFTNSHCNYCTNKISKADFSSLTWHTDTLTHYQLPCCWWWEVRWATRLELVASQKSHLQQRKSLGQMGTALANISSSSSATSSFQDTQYFGKN